MKDNLSVLEADLDYATRMVLRGFGTVEQAALACGVRIDELQARVAQERNREGSAGSAPAPRFPR